MSRPTFFGVCHLLPLPGAPTAGPPLSQIIQRAVRDAKVLADGGADGVVVENFGDAPFARGRVGPHVVSAMTAVALAVRDAAPSLRLCINVLRNDAAAALAIASTTGAEMVRINVHCGTMVTDQGLIEGRAHESLTYARQLEHKVTIAADVAVKHAAVLGDWELADLAKDTHYRGRAPVLIISGSGTGRPASPDDVAIVRAACPSAQVWIGSGSSLDNVRSFEAHGFIVGTALHEERDLSRPLEASRVTAFFRALTAHS